MSISAKTNADKIIGIGARIIIETRALRLSFAAMLPPYVEIANERRRQKRDITTSANKLYLLRFLRIILDRKKLEIQPPTPGHVSWALRYLYRVHQDAHDSEMFWVIMRQEIVLQYLPLKVATFHYATTLLF